MKPLLAIALLLATFIGGYYLGFNRSPILGENGKHVCAAYKSPGDPYFYEWYASQSMAVYVCLKKQAEGDSILVMKENQ
jgi:hypothetical protein